MRDQPRQSKSKSRSNQSEKSDGGGYRGRLPYRGARKFPAISERPLLQEQIPEGPEQFLGVADGSSRFIDAGDMSESVSDTEHNSSDSGNEEKASHKKTRGEQESRADGNSVPKWSNPDPYVVLPPPDQTTGKKKDFVQLIRKSKVTTSATPTSAKNGIADNDDFISFNFGDEPALVGSLNDLSAKGELPGPAKVNSDIRRRNDITLPSRPPPPPPPPTLPPPPPPRASGLKRTRRQYESPLVREWQPASGFPTVPWFRPYGDINNDQILRRFHNEILDFYDYVMPTPHDEKVRRSLVARVEGLLRREFRTINCRLLVVGSSPAGLHLPTGDIDVVLVSQSFEDYGATAFEVYNGEGRAKKVLNRASRPLYDIAVDRKVLMIWKARVPIVKFVDNLTRLQVDISFEKLDAMRAQATFKDWRANYPDMTYLVALVKQFLLMRGLCDVHTGGLGGFSIVCLVVSFLQLKVRLGEDDLGTLFMKFLDYYGNEFDLANDMISLNPPQIFQKQEWGVDGRAEKHDRLSIIDPNDENNNISGGSSKVQEIFRLFSLAHKELKERIAYLKAHDLHESFLEPIYGGNYESYEQQRRILNGVRV
jgi:non-canonical poly(A) RNA polymerase PAPD5/7